MHLREGEGEYARREKDWDVDVPKEKVDIVQRADEGGVPAGSVDCE